jgi:hypothetical protein
MGIEKREMAAVKDVKRATAFGREWDAHVPGDVIEGAENGPAGQGANLVDTTDIETPATELAGLHVVEDVSHVKLLTGRAKGRHGVVLRGGGLGQLHAVSPYLGVAIGAASDQRGQSHLLNVMLISFRAPSETRGARR